MRSKFVLMYHTLAKPTGMVWYCIQFKPEISYWNYTHRNGHGKPGNNNVPMVALRLKHRPCQRRAKKLHGTLNSRSTRSTKTFWGKARREAEKQGARIKVSTWSWSWKWSWEKRRPKKILRWSWPEAEKTRVENKIDLKQASNLYPP